ncbi:MAG: hypothetical protein UR96_C0005G0039 [candidate division WS6 bacterium GW2011_GWC1_36_11]|uniref:Uncharacterized protein n=1 Tax=candidate division WS6 bacterium GW2011_GWC1_36_11 TaxID=1619090 RepID=A0A0G0FZP2_9BACT|nr:MAG: hypothetical protein UR96_C0005G0039 [candidate division WS6 bacterium GW2011_GWC1_36_11]
MKRETSKKIRNVINVATAIILLGGILVPIILTLVNI